MKRSIYIFLSILVFATLNSCESLIDEKVFTDLVEDNIYTTTEGCDAALNGVYAGFFTADFFGNVTTHVNTNLSVLYTRRTTQVSNNFTDGAGTAFFGQVWAAYYKSVNRTNDVIKNVSKSEIAAADKNRILGEAYFLRAMLYFDIVRYWGGVPLRIEPTIQENINMPKSISDQVYEQVLADLEQAKQFMVDQGKQKAGRPNKMAAYALAQKVYLTLAGNDQASPYWQKSLTEGLVVYNSSAYQLVSSYKDLWDIKKQNSKEAIFEIPNSAGQTTGGSLTRFFLPNNINLTPLGACWGRAMVNKEVYDKHVKRYPGDPRIDATYLDSSYIDATGKLIKTWPVQKTGANSYTYILKYVDPAYVGNVSNSNLIYLRYADVLLMLAEAENEINGPDRAYAYVNAVVKRARGNGNQPADWSGMTKEQFRDAVMAERSFELLGEMQDYLDVRRRGKDYLKKIIEYHNTYPANIANKEYTVATDDATLTKAMLLPIPMTEMTTNSALKPEDQNPGY